MSQTFSCIYTPTLLTPVILHTYLPVKVEQTECSETLAYKIQTVGNYPEESVQHSEHGKSLKLRISLKMLKLQIAYQQVYVHNAVTTAHSDEPPLIQYHSRFFFLGCAHKHP